MTFEQWRDRAREFLMSGVEPDDALWDEAQPALFTPRVSVAGQRRISREFLELAKDASCHRDPARWALLYRLAYRLTGDEPHLLAVDIDPDTARLRKLVREVRHDIHRMHGFVRFRAVYGPAGEEYIAWHVPDHPVVERAAPWFRDRFAPMRWSILTPFGCAFWDREKLQFGPGVPASAAPTGDCVEELWRTYYAATFNPGRANESGLLLHMPKRYWAALPESREIPELLRSADQRVSGMTEPRQRSAALYIPPSNDLNVLASAIRSCQGCDLFRCATHPVFGEGPADAELMFVGEQPGDNEDREARPFVGPAGQLFDRAMSEAGLDRSSAYITGAVKHFKYEERGKRRIHKTANRAEVVACQPWLSRQIEIIRPTLIVAMGNTAALSVLGRQCAITRERSSFLPHATAEAVFLTVHPSFVLRIPEPQMQQQEYGRLVADLCAVRERLSQPATAASMPSAS